METLPLSVFLLGVWGILVSWVEERSSFFRYLSPSWKQAVNAAITAVVPALVAWSANIWRPEFGNAVAVFEAILFLGVPWLISQVAHYVDLYFNKQTS